MQSPLANPPVAVGTGNGQNRKMLANRLVEITLATGTVREFVYLNEKRQTANSEILAISATKFLVLERDGNFPSSGSAVKKIYLIDTSVATDIHDPLDGNGGKQFTGGGGSIVGSVTTNLEDFIRQHTAAIATPTITDVTTALTAISVTPVTRTALIDLSTYKAVFNHDKPEGLALVGSKLYVINDDDFGVTDEESDGTVNSLTMPILPKTVLGTTAKQNLNGAADAGKAGLQDFTQILEIDLAAIGSTVVAGNNTPIIAVAGTLTVAVGADVSTAVIIGDVETPAASLTLGGVSSSSSAVITLGGSGSNRTLEVDGLSNGTATVTLLVTDAAGASRSATVTVTVGSGGGSGGGGGGSNAGSGCGTGSSSAGLLVGLLAMLGLRRRRS